MASAVNSNEKIREWNDHIKDIEELAEELSTVIKTDPNDKDYYGLTSDQAKYKLKEVGPNALTEK